MASDIDGTLLAATETPTARTRAVLARMADAGVPFVLATGRPPRWVPPVSDAVAAGLVVAANGAVLYDAADDRILEVATLDPPQLGEVLAGLRDAVPGCSLAVERVAAGATARAGERFLAEPAYEPAWPGSDHDAVGEGELGAEPVVKVLVRRVGVTSDVMADAARAHLGHLVDVTFSGSGGLVECSRRGVTKAFGLVAAATRLGVAAEHVVAFGDMPNDLEMLRWAGHGVGMANAHPAVLAGVDEVTASNLDDGVASVLERWF